MTDASARAAQVAALNDRLRREHKGGRLMMTATVAALGIKTRAALIAKLAAFDAFTEANDPYGEHDFGRIEHAGEVWLFKIDTYADATLTAGAEDPLAPEAVRVLTLMHESDY